MVGFVDSTGIDELSQQRNNPNTHGLGNFERTRAMSPSMANAQMPKATATVWNVTLGGLPRLYSVEESIQLRRICPKPRQKTGRMNMLIAYGIFFASLKLVCQA